jgi:phosphatidylinositol glycan class W
VLQAKLHFFTPYTIPAAVADFTINCASILFAITVYANEPLLLCAFLAAPAILVFFSSSGKQHGRRTAPPARPPPSGKAASVTFPIKPFVTMYRGHMMIITCAAILAVDFHIFPRRFAKVETWGTSLMDMGVGSFVFSAGVVSARSILKAQASGQSSKIASRLKDSARHSLPLLVLGLIRLYSVKGVDYAEHVTEYGVHWNFFFTLGFLPPFMALCHAAFSFIPSYAFLAFFISTVYQVVLDSTDLKAFILSAPRTGLLSQNREGIFSLAGYLAIFLAGQDTGMYVLPRETRTPPGSSLRSTSGFMQLQRTMIGKLITWTIIWTALLIANISYQGANIRVSRRLANLPYFLWVAAFNCAHLTLCATIEALCFPDIYSERDPESEKKKCVSATSRLLHAFNRNGLALFLLANLLTGAVNLTLPTLHMNTLETMAVLVVYVGVLSTVAIVLDAKNISVKL